MFVRPLLIAVMVAALVLVAALEVQAQVRFSIGGSGWSVGNGPSWYGPGYGYGYGWGPSYYNPPVIVERQVQPQVQYVPVQTQSAAYQGQGVAIRNPARNETPLSYTIDSQDEHEIAAGQTQRLMAKRTYVINFDRGGDFGHACYSIYEGWYQFTLTDRGWELFRQQGPMPADETVNVKANPLPGQKDKAAEPAAAERVDQSPATQPPPPVPPQET